LIMALSMLVIVSNKTRPAMIRMMERKSMNQEHIGFCPYKNVRERKSRQDRGNPDRGNPDRGNPDRGNPQIYKQKR
jgi:hypothetical protein